MSTEINAVVSRRYIIQNALMQRNSFKCKENAKDLTTGVAKLNRKRKGQKIKVHKAQITGFRSICSH